MLVQLEERKKWEMSDIADGIEIQKYLNNLFLNVSVFFKKSCLSIQKVVRIKWESKFHPPKAKKFKKY